MAPLKKKKKQFRDSAPAQNSDQATISPSRPRPAPNDGLRGFAAFAKGGVKKATFSSIKRFTKAVHQLDMKPPAKKSSDQKKKKRSELFSHFSAPAFRLGPTFPNPPSKVLEEEGTPPWEIPASKKNSGEKSKKNSGDKSKKNSGETLAEIASRVLEEEKAANLASATGAKSPPASPPVVETVSSSDDFVGNETTNTTKTEKPQSGNKSTTNTDNSSGIAKAPKYSDLSVKELKKLIEEGGHKISAGDFVMKEDLVNFLVRKEREKKFAREYLTGMDQEKKQAAMMEEAAKGKTNVASQAKKKPLSETATMPRKQPYRKARDNAGVPTSSEPELPKQRKRVAGKTVGAKTVGAKRTAREAVSPAPSKEKKSRTGKVFADKPVFSDNGREINLENFGEDIIWTLQSVPKKCWAMVLRHGHVLMKWGKHHELRNMSYYDAYMFLVGLFGSIVVMDKIPDERHTFPDGVRCSLEGSRRTKTFIQRTLCMAAYRCCVGYRGFPDPKRPSGTLQDVANGVGVTPTEAAFMKMLLELLDCAVGEVEAEWNFDAVTLRHANLLNMEKALNECRSTKGRMFSLKYLNRIGFPKVWDYVGATGLTGSCFEYVEVVDMINNKHAVAARNRIPLVQCFLSTDQKQDGFKSNDLEHLYEWYMGKVPEWGTYGSDEFVDAE